MKYIFQIISLIILVIVLFVVVTDRPQEQEGLGSVAQSGEYHSISTGESSGAGITNQLSIIPATLGSIVITGAAAGEIFVYNATTSDVTLRAGATSTLTVLAHIPDSLAVGTYTFDVVATQGLLVVLESVQPTTTITHR